MRCDAEEDFLYLGILAVLDLAGGMYGLLLPIGLLRQSGWTCGQWYGSYCQRHGLCPVFICKRVSHFSPVRDHKFYRRGDSSRLRNVKMEVKANEVRTRRTISSTRLGRDVNRVMLGLC